MWSIFRKKEPTADASIKDAKAPLSQEGEQPKIQVLGSIGCVSCKMQLAQMQEALKELGQPISNVEYVEDIEVALKYGIMSVPAVVINGKVIGSGKVIKKAQLVEMLKGQIG